MLAEPPTCDDFSDFVDSVPSASFDLRTSQDFAELLSRETTTESDDFDEFNIFVASASQDFDESGMSVASADFAIWHGSNESDRFDTSDVFELSAFAELGTSTAFAVSSAFAESNISDASGSLDFAE